MDSKEAFDKMLERINSTPKPFENEDWYREGIKAAQEKIIKEYFEKHDINQLIKIADPE